MPAQTSKGWPYVIPTDNVADYPVTSQGLATALDTYVPYRMADGSGSINNPGTSGVIAVVFPVGLFTVAPIVMVTKTGGNGAGRMTFFTSAITKDGCNVTVASADGVFTYAGVITFQWLAVQFGATIA